MGEEGHYTEEVGHLIIDGPVIISFPKIKSIREQYKKIWYRFNIN